MELTALDWVLFAVAAFFMTVGLFWGLSGQLGSLAGIVAALVAGYLLFVPVRSLVAVTGLLSGESTQAGAAAVVDFIVVLVVFGLVRLIVAKFVSFLIPQPLNAILGALVGLVKGTIAVVLLAGVGVVQTGRFSEGFFASHSTFVKVVGSLADSCMQGTSRSDNNQTSTEP